MGYAAIAALAATRRPGIDVVLKGLSGPITVNGQNYNGVMAAFGTLNDFNVAAIVTYERTSWGNDLGMVLPEEVAARR